MVAISRPATHSGSWYSSNPTKLSRQIDQYFQESSTSTIPGARVLIGPHAGYTYAGKTLAETFKSWDNSNVKRIFILGPSHHVYFKNKAYLSGADSYETPMGDVPVDKAIVAELTTKHKSIFKTMDTEMDEDEHSFEMHMPFVYHTCAELPQGIPTIVPIMISHTDEKFNEQFVEILAPYFQDKTNHFVISSDFCHWGSRFGYLKYSPTASLDDLTSVSTLSKSKDRHVPIWKSIEMLDKYAMKVATTGSSKSWRDYIKLTGNTICGQRPILLVLKIMENAKAQKKQSQVDAEEKDEKELDSEEKKATGKFKWIGYTQSSKVFSVSDSSVSYASGYAVV